MNGAALVVDDRATHPDLDCGEISSDSVLTRRNDERTIVSRKADLAEEVMFSLERWTYICLITLCVVAGGFIVRDHIRANELAAEAKLDPVKKLLGKTLTIPEEHWKPERLGLVVFTSSGCHFCEASIPFYERLVAASSEGAHRQIPIIAISAEPKEQLEKHYAAEHLAFDKTYQIPYPNGLLRGTPTIMIVDNRGVILRAFFGELPPSKEDEVLRIVRTQDIGAGAS